MGENNQENVQPQVQQTETQDPRLIRPEIIGELRKEKIGKPIMVIELFLLFGIVFAGLPFINSQLNDENSKLYQIIHNKGASVIVATTTTKVSDSEYADGSKNNIISSDLKMKFDSVIVDNISLSNDGLKCNVSAYNGVINLDEKDMYIELSSSSGAKVTAFKLYGKVDNVAKEYKLKASKFQYNTSMGYQIKMVKMTDDDYPDVTYSGFIPDANGYASFICSKDTRKITYKFKNNYLIHIVDEDKVVQSELEDDEYINMLAAARKKATSLGTSIASVEEDEDGYLYTANINLEGDYKIPETVIDYDYYPTDTLAKKVAYAQTSKGYDCQ